MFFFNLIGLCTGVSDPGGVDPHPGRPDPSFKKKTYPDRKTNRQNFDLIKFSLKFFLSKIKVSIVDNIYIFGIDQVQGGGFE